MKSLLKIAIFGAVAAAGSTVTLIYADPAPAVAPPAVPSMSVEVMTKQAAQIDAQIKDDAQRIVVLKAVSSKQRDVIKVNCVNDKLLVVKAQQNAGDDAYAQLRASLARGSDDRQKHFDAMLAASGEIKRMRNGAEECVGATELYREGQQTVEISHPAVLDDPTADTSEPFRQTMIEIPAYASPFD